ncbi:nucleotidyltransferase family protein [Nocardioides albidus]|uniref:Nucleotidyltransferase family protein n=1 Tax=Nocardioides albidus TaxID=1517589 RepID=A0A5C4VX57_9ACTN|nr:NTP transferase domain-containing protein [Nocardioides albidus]TNM40477.1 nucleotidyltransferase family protein [Nocardioides albidus]
MVDGLLLAAGAGRRMGMPKALVRDDDGTPWLTRSVQVLRDGGCARVLVVLGAAADEAMPLLDGLSGVTTVRSEDWSSGMGASLATGLAALAAEDADAALVHLVDLPDVTAAVVGRVLDQGGAARSALARASYDGVPGHPVLLGRDHWAGVVDSASGDRGARAYLADHDVRLVECGDLATGADVDSR